MLASLSLSVRRIPSVDSAMRFYFPEVNKKGVSASNEEWVWSFSASATITVIGSLCQREFTCAVYIFSRVYMTIETERAEHCGGLGGLLSTYLKLL